MQRPVLFRFRSIGSATSASGYTLVEILVATTLSLMLLGAVVRMFGDVSQSIGDSRSMLESADRLRLVQIRLQQDLAGVTVTMSPPRKPENNEGYFEYIEGPVGTTLNTTGTAMTAPSAVAVNSDNGYVADTSVGDVDDILMFTTRSTGQPFVGRYPPGVNRTTQSDVAEVAWFVRGRTLYRRVLLVSPALGPWATSAAPEFYATNDISVSIQNGQLVANTLGDLTKRENRFAHQTGGFPYSPYVSVAPWTNGSSWLTLRLPTLCECSYYKDATHNWSAGSTLPDNGSTPGIPLTLAAGFSAGQFDAWRMPLPYSQLDPATGAHNSYYTPGSPTAGQRIAEDVILTNVIGFDVKAWDPTYNGSVGAYVDLGYNSVAYNFAWDDPNQSLSDKWIAGTFGHLGHPKSQLNPATSNGPRVYDTWSTHYESVGTVVGDTRAGRAINGFDDTIPAAELPPGYTSPNPNGVVDDALELITSPPYPIPLRGIQVKIRVFEPDSRQIREVTVVQDFLSQ